MTFKVDTVEIVGKEGTTFTPRVVNNVLSWSNNGGLKNPPSVYIKGEQGIQGERGETGKPTESIKDNIVSLETTFSSEKIVNEIDKKTMESLSNAFNNLTVVKGEKITLDSVIENSKNGIIKDFIIKGVTKKINGKLVSVGEGNKIELSTTDNINLFNPNDMIINKNTTYGYSKIQKNEKQLCLSIIDKDNSIPITGIYLGFSKYGVDSSGTPNWIISDGGVKKNFIVSNLNYISIFPNNQETLNTILKRFDIMLNYGDSPIPYKPYVGDRKNLNIKIDGQWKGLVNLRGIDDTHCDTFDSTNNILTVKTKQVTINGSLGWRNEGEVNNSELMSFLVGFYPDANSNSTILCDKFINGSDNSKELIRLLNTNLQVIIRKDKLKTQDLQGFKNWLNENPLTIIYELKQNVIYDASPMNLITFDGQTKLTTNSEVEPIVEGYYSHNLTDLVINYLNRISNIENELYK